MKLKILFLCCAAFLFEDYVLGWHFLNPSTPWLTYGDQTQHFLGWAFARQEPWHWPPGAVENYNVFQPTSVGLTDSIPLLALFFKLFSSVLPDYFQYFGMWALLNSFLCGLFGLFIARRLTDDSFLQLIFALFLMTSTLLAANLHGALGAHWLILGSIYYYTQEKHAFLPQLALVSLAASIHPYLLAFVFAFLFFKTLCLCRTNTSFLALGQFIFLLLWAAALSFLCGHFVGGSSVLNYGGFGHFRLYPRDFFSPQGEIFLGIGVFALGILVIWKRFQTKEKIKAWRTSSPGFFWCVGILTLYAFLGPKFAQIPGMHFFAGIFRANGRFGWVFFYVCLIFVLAGMIQFFPKKTAKMLLLAAFCIQILNLHPFYSIYSAARQSAQHQQHAPAILKDVRWNDFARQNAQILMFINAHAHTQHYVKQAEPIALFAQQHHMSTNYLYTARTDYAAMMQKQNQEWARLINGHARDNTLYVFFDDLPREMLDNSLPPEYASQLIAIENYHVLAHF